MDLFVLIKLTIFETLLLCSCLWGDWALQTKFIKSDLYRAYLDSFIHALVGFLSWCCVTSIDNKTKSNFIIWFSQTLLCTCLALFIDLDHFVAARSFSFKAARSLPKRPALHNSTLIPVITFWIWILVRTKSDPILRSLPWIFLLAWTSHHLRDATRRGLWFTPFGSTPALPSWLYIGLTMALPLIVSRLVYGHVQSTESISGTEYV